MDEKIKEIEAHLRIIRKNHERSKEYKATLVNPVEEGLLVDAEYLLSHIKELEEQLNVGWDDERVREISKRYTDFEKLEKGYVISFTAWKDIQYILFLIKKERMEKKELGKIISDGILKDHNGCGIFRDEEYTKLESKFYEAEIMIDELRKKLIENK